MKSLKPTLLIAMLSGIFQGFIIAAVVTAIVKQDTGYIIVAAFCSMISVLFWLSSYDRAIELRDWINPAKEEEFKNIIPQDAIDRQWIKEIEETYNSYNYPYGNNDPLTQAKMSISIQEKDLKIRTLISSAKTARGIRLPKNVTIRSDD